MTDIQAASAFPLTAPPRRGYAPDDVDAFLAAAREAYEQESGAVTAADIRRASFALEPGGYDVAAVDAALTRIEDAFALRERAQALAAQGAQAWVGETRALAQEVLDRLHRPRRRRFTRVGLLRFGYRVDEVDIVADRIARYLETGEGLTVQQVRTVAFRMQLGGYDETQVDAVLDAVIDVILSVG